MNREIVVTGVGAVTPLGVGARTLYERWRAGVSGIEDGVGAASEFDPTEHLSIKEARRADRFTQFSMVASDEALPQFGVEESEITRDATFEELDVDSLDLAELSQIIEDEFGVQLKGEDVAKIKTVGDAVDLVVSRAG